MKNPIAIIGVFTCIIMSGLCIATQELAAAVKYDPLIGSPLFVIGGTPIYWPFKILVWYLNFYHVIPKLFDSVFDDLFYLGLLSSAFIFFWMQKMKSKNLTTHGTARWAEEKDIVKAKLLKRNFWGMSKVKKEGIILGRFPSTNWRGEKKLKYLRHDGAEHTLVMAPTRSGKGVGIIVPTLLTWLYSAIITDIKGENWGLTAGFRQKVLGHKVIKFEPTSLDSAKFNPFGEIRFRTAREVSDIQNITNIMVDPQGKGDLTHWDKAAQSLMVGAILYLGYVEPENCSPGGLISFLTQPRGDGGIIDRFNDMRDKAHVSEDDMTIFEVYGDTGLPHYRHPIICRTAMEMLQKAEEELAGVVSSVTALLSIYNDPILAQNLSSNDFHIEDLMNHEQPVSLYLVVPPSDIDRMNPVFRLIIELLLRRSIEKMNFENGKFKKTYKHRLLLLLDEFPGLGRMDTMERALAYIAGYGITAVLIVQSLSQLAKNYTENNSIIDNCHIRVFFTPNDAKTPEYVSKALGKRTEIVHNESFRKNEIFNGSESTTSIGRDLLTPGEVSLIPYEDELIFVTGYPPIMAKKVFYYSDPNFKNRLMAAPKESDKTVLGGTA